MKKRMKRMGLRARLILLVMLVLVMTVTLSALLSEGLRLLLPAQYHPPQIVELLVASLIIGGFFSHMLGKWFIGPINRLGDAMNRVAKGDFNAELSETAAAPEIRNIYEKFNLMVRELRATEVLQTDFVSNVSHEFKTPISAIEGYATLLQGREDLTEADQERYIEKIVFNTRRLSVLVGNILLMSRLDNQAIQSPQNTYRLDEQIRQSILLLENEWVEKEVEFDIEMEDVKICAAEAMMHHVWLNLISNAIKFGPRCGLIRIRLHKRGALTVFEIEDSGPGIDEEAQKHIFDKFYQADSSHKQEGNGLGLALVKKILNQCGGQICVQNISGGGCRFIVLLHAA